MKMDGTNHQLRPFMDEPDSEKGQRDRNDN